MLTIFYSSRGVNKNSTLQGKVVWDSQACQMEFRACYSQLRRGHTKSNMAMIHPTTTTKKTINNKAPVAETQTVCRSRPDLWLALSREGDHCFPLSAPLEPARAAVRRLTCLAPGQHSEITPLLLWLFSNLCAEEDQTGGWPITLTHPGFLGPWDQVEVEVHFRGQHFTVRVTSGVFGGWWKGGLRIHVPWFGSVAL